MSAAGGEPTSTSAVEFHPLYLVAITGAGRAPVASCPGASGSLFSARGLNVRFGGTPNLRLRFILRAFSGLDVKEAEKPRCNCYWRVALVRQARGVKKQSRTRYQMSPSPRERSFRFRRGHHAMECWCQRSRAFSRLKMTLLPPV